MPAYTFHPPSFANSSNDRHARVLSSERIIMGIMKRDLALVDSHASLVAHTTQQSLFIQPLSCSANWLFEAFSPFFADNLSIELCLICPSRSYPHVGQELLELVLPPTNSFSL
jgi:hypothetical protein